MARIKLSIIIATKNESSNLPRLFDSLRKQTEKDFETIIVDNHSQDQTLQISRKFTPHVYTHGEERSAQRNFGAQYARGKYLLFLDADMELAPTIISDCMTSATDSNVVAIIVPETTKGTSYYAKIKALEMKLYTGELDIESPRFFLKATFQRLSGYNESLIAGEDWDLTQRIRTLGRIVRTHTPLLHHNNSLMRELRHKIYYASKIHDYSKIQPQLFKQQSGKERLLLFWRKRDLLVKTPLNAIGLIGLKSIEFFLFLLIKLSWNKNHE